MKEIPRTNLIVFLKKILLIGISLFITTFLQVYSSMGKLSTKISSGCLDCSFIEDALLITIITTFFLTILFLFFSLIVKKSIRIALEFIFVISAWLFWNYTIFVGRESSWSTYLFHEEIYYTILYSFFPILILSSILIYILNRNNKLNLRTKLISNPKKNFLIDALGALLSTLLLFGILAQLEEYFGMPKEIIYLLSGIAFCLFMYSINCYRFIKSNWKPFLRILIICNILYLLISLAIVITYSEKLTELGWLYFKLELIVILIIVIIEYKTYLKIKTTTKSDS